MYFIKIRNYIGLTITNQFGNAIPMYILRGVDITVMYLSALRTYPLSVSQRKSIFMYRVVEV